MIVTCDGCQTKYLLGDEKVPEKGIRVRCPKCRFVWRLVPPDETESVFDISSSEFASSPPIEDEVPKGGWASMEGATESVLTETEPRIEEVEIPLQGVEAEPEIESPEKRRKKDRARRLARVFVSDILIYNKEKRDRGLENGNLMAVLGPEIKKAWEAYKEKIGSDVSESNEYFRTALNEILAEGQEIF